jgi:hypothetical protein
MVARGSHFGRISLLARAPGKVPAKKENLDMLGLYQTLHQTRNPTVPMPPLSSNFGRIFFRNYAIFSVT